MTCVYLLHFAFPFIFNYMVVFIFSHIKAIIFHIEIFLRGAYLDATKLFEVLKLLLLNRSGPCYWRENFRVGKATFDYLCHNPQPLMHRQTLVACCCTIAGTSHTISSHHVDDLKNIRTLPGCRLLAVEL